MNIYHEIKRLINFGLDKGFITSEDELYVRNRLLDILRLDDYEDIQVQQEKLSNPQPILENILDYAYENGILEQDTITYRDLLDTKLMDCFMSKPSDVIRRFYNDYEKSPALATDNYYKMSIASNYIRTERTDRNAGWKTETDFGQLDITINLSKPEKDPIAIAAAKNMKATSYPKCLLCKENEGFAGTLNHPARNNHRIIPLNLRGEKWFLQYSPYVYYNEHCIVLKDEHVPMRITEATFERLLEFVAKFPHYFIGSNADLPIVGGSILSHDHFQGGNYCFAMETAPSLKQFSIKGFEYVEVSIVKWPMSVIRIRSVKRERLSVLAGKLLDAWRAYSDEDVGIIAFTGEEPHNTITPIARFREGAFELDLVLRNNRTSEEHPLGIFHPHSDVHHIKKENIGLIEVMGLAVLPARLINELQLIKACLEGSCNIGEHEELEQHKPWFCKLKEKYDGRQVDYESVLKQEVGRIFERVLLDAGVFKPDEKGLLAFSKFIESIR
ncbi:MAG TPA: UDP-glucose--hexose-1-phosphate uridylyltransferase [Negativicutes bacterium]|nr:UDP-glucose--hexose-1-phosphate uridylyltransferase [Negativicutes bacterium]